MDDMTAPPWSTPPRGFDERFRRAAWRVLRCRGLPDDRIQSEIERLLTCDPGFVLPTPAELGLEPDPVGKD